MPSPAYDVLIIGSGAAGLSLALRLAGRARVAVLSKTALSETNTLYAQGGISAVLDAQDSLESHIQDTLAVGAGLCDPEVVQLVVSQGKACIDWLLERGVPFTEVESENGVHQLHLTREGGHTHRRIVHAADATGRAVETSLEQHARAHPDIALFEYHNAIDLITARKLRLGEQRVLGVYALDSRQQRVKTFRARFVVLASGGASKVYLYTSNPDIATGDGIAMAWRAGARIANMEFIQFHPTCLFHPHARSFLISEAVRGEGGRLLLPDGSPFMHRFDPRGELAPRDIVARAIDHEMKRLGIDCVYLDISHQPAEFIKSHFPTIYARCLEFNIDITRQPIPVVPAAHYTCGGVLTDRHARTDIPGLYAIGEVACTGLHGANRMASNSLLECLVFAKQAAEDILRQLPGCPDPPTLPEWDESQVTDSDEEVVVSHNWDEIRRFMWDYVGIVRTDKRLQRALRRVELLKQEIAEYYGNFRVTNDLLELRNLVIVAELIIRSALARKESRGLHFTLDYPAPDESQPPRNTVLSPEPVPPSGQGQPSSPCRP
ncbi:L-aspartate oxidase [Candidatus Methylocalor cossyra]|uniref:L-aspartate oxidase n=1 Tax=Candidatus Methylocalor cossyra TaxID=3108543 RepID=A0ABP1C5D7_9GAMM